MDKSMGRYRITGKDTAERLKEDRACSKALKYSFDCFQIEERN